MTWRQEGLAERDDTCGRKEPMPDLEKLKRCRTRDTANTVRR